MVGKVELKKLYTTKTIFLDGLDGWMGVKAVSKIAYSNQQTKQKL